MTARLIPAAAVLVALARLPAADPPPAAPDPGKPAAPAAFVGVAQCIGCHSFENAGTNPGAGLYVRAGSNRFVRLNENITWSSHDLHSRAFANLDPATNGTAKGMQERLAPRRPAGYTVAGDVSCLACHASDKSPGVPPAKKEVGGFDTLAGVSCESCHGPASNWLRPHADLRAGAGGAPGSAWRDWPAAVKADWGLADLRDPAARADRCAACHVGRPAEGKFVTHEMFAAGHPPLPPLDVVAYARDQPRHWGLPRELPHLVDAARDHPADAWARFRYRAEADEVYAARQLAESAVATLRASVRTIAELTAEADADGGLDYAAFDCYACHHDLKYPSPRQKRGYAGVPGRPTFRPGMTAVARVVARHAAGADLVTELDELERELARGFDRRTLGDPAAIRAAAGRLEAWCGRVLAAVAGVRYTRAEAVKLFGEVVRAGADRDERVADPESGQLLTWALIALRDELRDTHPAEAEPPGLAAAVGVLDGLVVTRLRADPPGGAGVTPASVEGRLADRMRRFNGFDPPAFRTAFRTIEPLAGRIK